MAPGAKGRTRASPAMLRRAFANRTRSVLPSRPNGLFTAAPVARRLCIWHEKRAPPGQTSPAEPGGIRDGTLTAHTAAGQNAANLDDPDRIADTGHPIHA